MAVNLESAATEEWNNRVFETLLLLLKSETVTKVKRLLSDPESRFYPSPKALNLSVPNEGQIHFIYFRNEGNSSLAALE